MEQVESYASDGDQYSLLRRVIRKDYRKTIASKFAEDRRGESPSARDGEKARILWNITPR